MPLKEYTSKVSMMNPPHICYMMPDIFNDYGLFTVSDSLMVFSISNLRLEVRVPEILVAIIPELATLTTAGVKDW